MWKVGVCQELYYSNLFLNSNGVVSDHGYGMGCQNQCMEELNYGTFGLCIL